MTRLTLAWQADVRQNGPRDKTLPTEDDASLCVTVSSASFDMADSAVTLTSDFKGSYCPFCSDDDDELTYKTNREKGGMELDSHSLRKLGA